MKNIYTRIKWKNFTYNGYGEPYHKYKRFFNRLQHFCNKTLNQKDTIKSRKR